VAKYYRGGGEVPKYYRIEPARVQAIADKANELTRWVAEHAPYCETSQKHLDAGTPEQGYWNYGYLCGIKDILGVIKSPSAQ
jgi:hypothetical protein